MSGSAVLASEARFISVFSFCRFSPQIVILPQGPLASSDLRHWLLSPCVAACSEYQLAALRCHQPTLPSDLLRLCAICLFLAMFFLVSLPNLAESTKAVRWPELVRLLLARALFSRISLTITCAVSTQNNLSLLWRCIRFAPTAPYSSFRLWTVPLHMMHHALDMFLCMSSWQCFGRFLVCGPHWRHGFLCLRDVCLRQAQKHTAFSVCFMMRCMSFASVLAIVCTMINCFYGCRPSLYCSLHVSFSTALCVPLTL